MVAAAPGALALASLVAFHRFSVPEEVATAPLMVVAVAEVVLLRRLVVVVARPLAAAVAASHRLRLPFPSDAAPVV